MDLRQLRYFLAIAEHRHFTRAAEACFVSQPALSQRIRSLERELGTSLFDRLPRGVELTAAGRVLRPHAERVVRDVENARIAVEEVVGQVRGEVSISTVQTANLSIVVESVARYRAMQPAVAVRVHEERSVDVIASVLAGKVNLGVVYLPLAERNASVEPLYDEELVLVVPDDDGLAGGTIPVGELSNLPLLLPPGGYCLREGIDAALEKATVAPRVMAEISALESLCEAVRVGLGMAIVPLAYARRAPAMGGLSVARIDPPLRRTIGVVRHTDRRLCLATRGFLQTLQAVSREQESMTRPAEAAG